MLASLLLATTLAVSALAPQSPIVEPQVSIKVDSARGEVIIIAGPYDLPNMPADMAEMHMGSPQVLRFDWPIDGGVRGFNLSMQTEDGKPLPKSVIHHLIAVNFDRRQIVYRMVERLFGWGKETDPVMLPSGVGVPLARGQHLGVYAMWHNDTGQDIHNAYLRMTLAFIPKSRLQNPVLPLYVDVNNHIGGVTTFDVAPGKSSRAYEFEFPLSGRLIGIGGHLHDYGAAVRLEDAETGKVLVRLKSDRDKNGEISKVGRFIWGFHEEALPIEAHHKYRVVAEYDNPTGKAISQGGMGHINGVFSPNDMAEWPVLDVANADIKRDIETLPSYSEMSASRPTKGQVNHGAAEMKSMKMNNAHGDSTTASSSMANMPGMSEMQQRGDSTKHH
ncbi:MAG: hypothetical protein ABI889_16115 [Gemmatimonadota bacterium]